MEESKIKGEETRIKVEENSQSAEVADPQGDELKSTSEEIIIPGDTTVQKDHHVTYPEELPPSIHVHCEKKLSDYLFEFIMLFLAVTAGFVVENLREHYIENLDEKKYARSLYDDLKIDTAVLQRVMDYKKWSSEKMDSLLILLPSHDNSSHNELIYYFERVMISNDIFTSQDLTYRQLEGSGNFRYIENHEMYNHISDYYNLYSRYLTIVESQFEEAATLTEMESKLFNVSDLASMYNPNSTSITTLYKRAERKFAPLGTDQYYLNYFFIKASNRLSQLEGSVTWLAWLKDKSTKIIIDLKEEYGLE
jgi:hypothetical protein